MAYPQLHYFSRENANLPSLQTAEIDAAEVDQLVEALCHQYQQLVQQGEPNPQLVCDISSNNFNLKHLQRFTDKLIASDIHLFALDLWIWNLIYARSWDLVLPTNQRLLSKTKHLDMSGHYILERDGLETDSSDE